MTAYVADVTLLGYPANSYYVLGLGIRAPTTPDPYQLRIARIETTTTVYISRWSGATLNTGGPVLTPVRMREGAPAATSTARIVTQLVSAPGTISGNYPAGTRSDITKVAADYQFPFDFIVNPGSAFFVSSHYTTYVSGSSNGSISVRVFYEELHLSRST